MLAAFREQPDCWHLARSAHANSAPVVLLAVPDQRPDYSLSMQSFVHSGQAQAEFQPMPLPQLRLSVEDQCRLRDRSTIMARQMYAIQGPEFADAQVGVPTHAAHAD